MAATPVSAKPVPAADTGSLRARLLVLAATAAVFVRALPYPLQRSWDDGRFIIDNPLVRHPSWHAFVAFWTHPQLEAYHPLHLLSYWLDAPWFGPSPLLLHAVSLGLWLIAATLLWGATRRLGLSATGAAVATLACVLHPVQVEAVSWATGRKDVLALLFASACLVVHLRSEHWLDRRAWLVRGLYLAGALSKTTILPLPAVLWLADVVVRRRSALRAARAQLPSAVLGTGLALVVLVVWREHAMLRPEGGGMLGAMLRAVSTFGHQLGTALWPASTAPMYAMQTLGVPSVAAWSALAAFVLVFAALLWGRWRGHPCAALGAFGLGAFGLLLLPVTNLVTMYFPYQDRYLSLPLIGLGVACGALWDALSVRALRAPIAVALCVLGLRCVQYQGVWSSEPRLWGHAASTQPNAYYAWMKLGEVRRRAGDLYGSIRAYRHLIALKPTRKAGYAALLLSTALRDERIHHIAPSHAEAYAAQFYRVSDDPTALRDLAASMLAAGYLRALEVPLARSLSLQPVPDVALEHAARVQFAAGHTSVGTFYLRHMRQPTRVPELRAVLKWAERAFPAAPRIVD